MEQNADKRMNAGQTSDASTPGPKKKRTLLLKALLLAAILLAVFAIWIVKNPNAVPGKTQAAVSAEQNADFALEAESIDLSALMAYQLPVVIDFGSDSCIPCQQMAPVLKSANADYQGKAIIKFVDVWENPDAASGFPLQVIPTQVFFNADGTPYAPSQDFCVEFIFYSTSDTNEHVFTAHQGALTLEQLQAILADMGAGE